MSTQSVAISLEHDLDIARGDMIIGEKHEKFPGGSKQCCRGAATALLKWGVRTSLNTRLGKYVRSLLVLTRS